MWRWAERHSKSLIHSAHKCLPAQLAVASRHATLVRFRTRAKQFARFISTENEKPPEGGNHFLWRWRESNARANSCSLMSQHGVFGFFWFKRKSFEADKIFLRRVLPLARRSVTNPDKFVSYSENIMPRLVYRKSTSGTSLRR